MMKITRADTSVGVFLLVALGSVMIFLIAKAGSQGWLRGTKHFLIQAEDGHNIQDQAPVRMNGIRVGVVEKIDMAPVGTKIEVHFRIDPAFGPKIKEDAQATIVEPPVLGLTFIDINPGSQTRAEATGALPMKYEEPKTFMSTIDSSVKRVESIMKKTDEALEKANTALASISKIAGDIAEGDGFVSKLIRDQQLSNDLKKTVAHVSVMSEDLTDATGALRRREGAVGRLISSDELIVQSEKLLAQARESLQSLDAVTARLTKSVELVASRLDTAGASVEGVKLVLDNTKKITSELATLTQNLNLGKGTMGKFLADDAVFVEAKGLLKELRETVQDLREQAPINSFIGVVFSAF